MVRNSWALTWSLENITVMICISETGTRHCSGKRHVWAEGALLSSILLDICGSRKGRQKSERKGQKGSRRESLNKLLECGPDKSSKYVLKPLIDSWGQKMLSKSVLLYRTAFISVAASNAGGCYVTQVVSQCLLGTTGLGEISIYGVEGSLLTPWGWKQISCLYLVKVYCSIATGCIKKPWTLLINSGERSLPAVLVFLLSISVWMHLLDSPDGKNNHGLLHFCGPSFMVLCRELHEKVLFFFLNLYIWRYFLEGWKADILVPCPLLWKLECTSEI